MKDFFRLIRYKNILMIMLVQILIRYCVLEPLANGFGFALQMETIYFTMLVLSTALIAAGGYIINDINDKSIDKLNDAEKLIVGNKISEDAAQWMYYITTGAGILSGTILSYHINKPSFAMIFIIITGILWFYSDTYKKMVLAGNIIISVFTAMVPFIVVIYEVPALNKAYQNILIINNLDFFYLVKWTGAFSIFAFLCTFIREIIKDGEDYKGDSVYGRNTLPIVIGMTFTKIILALLLFVTLAAVIVFSILYIYVWPANTVYILSYIYIVVFIIIPLTYLLVSVITAKEKKHFTRASSIMKLIMLSGISFTIFIRIIFLQL